MIEIKYNFIQAKVEGLLAIPCALSKSLSNIHTIYNNFYAVFFELLKYL